MQTQATARQPISPTDMLNYLGSQSWYPQGWSSQFIDVFNDPSSNVHAATYGLESTPTIPAQLYNDSSTLWYLNFVYNCTLLGRSEDGYCNTNPLVFSDFENAIHEMGSY